MSWMSLHCCTGDTDRVAARFSLEMKRVSDFKLDLLYILLFRINHAFEREQDTWLSKIIDTRGHGMVRYTTSSQDVGKKLNSSSNFSAQILSWRAISKNCCKPSGSETSSFVWGLSVVSASSARGLGEESYASVMVGAVGLPSARESGVDEFAFVTRSDGASAGMSVLGATDVAQLGLVGVELAAFCDVLVDPCASRGACAVEARTVFLYVTMAGDPVYTLGPNAPANELALEILGMWLAAWRLET